MKKDNILFAIIGLLAGLIIGFFGTNQLNRNQMNQAASPAQPAQNSTASSGGQPKAAAPEVATAIENADKNPDDFEAQIKAGEMFARIKNFEKAIVYFETANNLKPNDYQTLIRLGNACFDSKKWLDAEKFYAQGLAIKSDDIAVRTDYGVTFAERATPDYDRAIKEFDLSLKINPKHEPTLFNLAVAYFKKGDIKNAEETKSKMPYGSEYIKKLDTLFLMK
jgi:tetratricopeptide (TPR) repeat protein